MLESELTVTETHSVDGAKPPEFSGVTPHLGPMVTNIKRPP